METHSQLKEIGIFIFNKVGAIYKGKENISEKIYRTLAYNKRLPETAYEIIPDKRYHKEFEILYGFKWYLGKLKEPPFDVYYPLLLEIARKISLPYIYSSQYGDLLLHTLLVDYFDTQC